MAGLMGGVPQVLVFRRRADAVNVAPEYFASPRRSPKIVAEAHWRRNRNDLLRMFPPEITLRNGLRIRRATYLRFVWVDTISEVNRGAVNGQRESEWWAEFAFHSASLAVRDGLNWVAFSWTTGEPQSLDWQGPKMGQFLELAANHPDRIAIAFHGNGHRANGGHSGPHADLLGRLRRLYDTTHRCGLPRPTVLITKPGCAPAEAGSIQLAFEDDAQQETTRTPWDQGICAQYPEVLEAAVWTIGPADGRKALGFEPIDTPRIDYILLEQAVAP